MKFETARWRWYQVNMETIYIISLAIETSKRKQTAFDFRQVLLDTSYSHK